MSRNCFSDDDDDVLGRLAGGQECRRIDGDTYIGVYNLNIMSTRSFERHNQLTHPMDEVLLKTTFRYIQRAGGGEGRRAASGEKEARKVSVP